jgi:hypothetical protein
MTSTAFAAATVVEVRRLHRHRHYLGEGFLVNSLLIHCQSLHHLVNPVMTYEKRRIALQELR